MLLNQSIHTLYNRNQKNTHTHPQWKEKKNKKKKSGLATGKTSVSTWRSAKINARASRGDWIPRSVISTIFPAQRAGVRARGCGRERGRVHSAWLSSQPNGRDKTKKNNKKPFRRNDKMSAPLWSPHRSARLASQLPPRSAKWSALLQVSVRKSSKRFAQKLWKVPYLFIIYAFNFQTFNTNAYTSNQKAKN